MKMISELVDDIPEGWKLIAAIDESESYEVDITEIFKVGDEFVLLTASGCSCWGGEYETRAFESLEELETGIRGDRADQYLYNPSFSGLETLLKMARENI